MTVKMTSAKSRSLVILMTLVMVQSVPLDSTTSRSLQFGDSIDRAGNHVMEFRKSSDDLVLDTRTPPKIKIHTKKKDKLEPTSENSHAGIAIPIDEDSIKLEETTKKLNFYKIQRPTTNSGLSTWILLSGDVGPTTPKAVNITDTEDMKVIEISGTRIVKPMFKKRTTTRKPTTQETTTVKSKATTESSTKRTKPSPNLVKIKASTLSNAQKKNNTKIIGNSMKEVTEHPMERTKITIFNRLPNMKTTTTPVKTSYESSTLKSTTEISSTKSPNNTALRADSENLPLESKDGEINITEAPTNNKKKKNKNKKNKNKNRRKKPEDKSSNTNSTKVAKNKHSVKEKPLGTQLYNYLSREMMPTLGVGLVGLMVTAGLASYFLYPFGVARRSYEVDRKDKEGSYYYNDIYSGGIAEEEALGKVIAGMPLNKLQNNLFKTPTTRKTVSNYPHSVNSYYQPYQNHANHQTHQSLHHKHSYQSQSNYQPQQAQQGSQSGMVQGTVESVPLGPTKNSYLVNPYEKDSYQPITYKDNEVNSNKDTEISVDKKFVVGNIPKEIVEERTPAAVPEHGPRMLRIRRRRRREVNDLDNDVYNDEHITDSPLGSSMSDISTQRHNQFPTTTTQQFLTSTQKNSTDPLESKVRSVVSLIKDIFHLKMNLGLEIVKNATRSISTYIEKVQRRLDTHYRNSQKYF